MQVAQMGSRKKKKIVKISYKKAFGLFTLGKKYDIIFLTHEGIIVQEVGT